MLLADIYSQIIFYHPIAVSDSRPERSVHKRKEYSYLLWGSSVIT